LKWEELSKEQQKRLQQPRNKLSKRERRLRKELFFGEGWIDASGHKHQFKPRKEEK